jgi:hypothetical protein
VLMVVMVVLRSAHGLVLVVLNLMESKGGKVVGVSDGLRRPFSRSASFKREIC